MSEPAAVWTALRDARQRVARLALLTCLPVRVAPELVRLARLRLVASGGTGDEADLWLSDLVETRAAAGFSYRRPARVFLRDTLRADVQLLDDLWSQVHLERAPWLTVRARLEEELTWRLLRNPADEAIGRLWEDMIAELDSGPNPEGVARWIVRALPDLPDGSLDHAAGRRAFYGASLLLGDAAVLGNEPQRFLESGDFAFATRHLPRRRIFVGLSARGLIVSGGREIENGHELDIPSTTPLWLQLEDPEASSPDVITIASDEHTLVPWHGGPVSFRTIDGALYRLERGHRTSQTGGSRRPGHVELTYDVELYGAEKKIVLPLVVGVLSDLAGRPVEPLAPLHDRKLLEIDRDNFDSRMQQMRPRISFNAPLGDDEDVEFRIELEFTRMDDFRPEEVARRIEPLRELLEARGRLTAFQLHITGNEMAQKVIDKGLAAEGALGWLAQLDEKEFIKTPLANDLMKVLDRETPEQRHSIAAGLLELARQAAASGTTVSSAWDAAAAFIERNDSTLSRRINLILHHEEFQRLEAAWRGLYELVERTDTNEMLKIRVLNLTKEELAESLAGDVDQCYLFKQVYEAEYGQFGGEPYGLLVADFYFGPGAEEVAILERLSAVCESAAVPLVSGASAALAGLADWSQLQNVTEIERTMSSAALSEWNGFRESPSAKFIGLAMPRFLARVPYTATKDANLGFGFEETAEGHSDFVWANAAYAMAINITRAFTLYGWCSRIAGERGGEIALPVHEFAATTGTERRSTETMLTASRELELTRQGLMALVSMKNADQAAFLTARPAAYGRRQLGFTDKSDELATDWRWLLPATRFVHYLKCITRDTIGSFRDRAHLEMYLQTWLNQQTDADPAHSTEDTQRAHPLAVGLLTVEGPDSGAFALRAKLLPHYQADYFTLDIARGINDGLVPELVTRLPVVLGDGGADGPSKETA